MHTVDSNALRIYKMLSTEHGNVLRIYKMPSMVDI